MLDQIFKDISDDAVLENVQHPWIFAMLSAVNNEIADEGRPVTLNARSTVAELKEAIMSLKTQSQLHIVSRTFAQYNVSAKESGTLKDSLNEIESNQTKHKLMSATVYTFLGLIVFFVVSTIGIGLTGRAAQVDESLGIRLFTTLMDLINLLYSS